MYCMALKVYTCEEAGRGPKTFLNIFCKLLQQKEPSPAWQGSWFQYQLTLTYNGIVRRRNHRVTRPIRLIEKPWNDLVAQFFLMFWMVDN
jgi:hypothetical protein